MLLTFPPAPPHHTIQFQRSIGSTDLRFNLHSRTNSEPIRNASTQLDPATVNASINLNNPSSPTPGFAIGQPASEPSIKGSGLWTAALLRNPRQSTASTDPH